MGGLRCAKEVLDGGRLASKAAEMEVLVTATSKAFQLLYEGGDLTDAQISQAAFLSGEMCEWAEWIAKRTDKVWSFHSTLTGGEYGGYERETKPAKDRP